MSRVSLFTVCIGLTIAIPVSAQWTDRREPAVGGSPDIPVTQGRFNAALQYHAAWMLLEHLLEYADFTPEQLEAIDEGVLPEAYAQALEADQQQIADLIAATRLAECDFGLHYEKGIGTLIPQLAAMRSSAKLLVNDARRLRDSDPDAVAERLAAAIRLGEHASQTHVVIGSLVGAAIVELARVETQKLLDAGRLNAGQARVIVASLDRVLTDDPFHGLGVLRAEASIMTAWIKFEYQGEGAGKELGRLLALAESGEAHGRRVRRELGRMNGEQIATMTDRMAEGYDALIEAWRADDPGGAVGEVERRMEKGEFGPVAGVLMPAMGSFHRRTLESEANLRKLRGELMAVPRG